MKKNNKITKATQALRDLDALFKDIEPEDYSSAIFYLSNKYEGLVFTFAGGAVPFQAYGNYKNKKFYFRFRGDRVALEIGDAVDKTSIIPDNGEIYFIESFTNNPYEGSMNCGEFQFAFEQLFEKYLKNSENSGGF